MSRHYARWAAAAGAVLLSSCSRTPDTDPHLVSAWVRTLYGVVRVERLSPPVASRLITYASTALYSGLTAASGNPSSLAGVLNQVPEFPRAERAEDYDATLTAVAAERVVMDSLLREGLPSTRAAVARLADSLAARRNEVGLSEATRSRSEDLGRRVGLAVVAWSRTDGFDSTRGRKFVAKTGLASWINDAPANVYATQNVSGASEQVTLNNPGNTLQAGNSSDRSLILSRPKRANATLPAVNMAGMSEPYWGQIRPFVLKTWNECGIPPVPSYGMDSASQMFADARQVHAFRTTLTPEQKAIAYYWADNAGESGTPPGHWMSIASQMVSERKLSAEAAARLMVLTAAAQADAFIASWGYKYQYSAIRPRTYIRRVIDSTWEPLIPTPPFPEYPSGHSTVSAAAATVLTEVVGDGPFTDSTGLSIGSAVRRFDSFTAAAEEAGMSRIYGGIHFGYGNLAGRTLGQCIGARAIERSRAARPR